MAKILDGKKIAKRVLGRVKEKIEERAAHGRSAPGLAVVLVGDDSASVLYVRKKRLDCRRAGIAARDYDLPADVAQAQLVALIEKLNADDRIHGILLQLPLPAHIQAAELIQCISPKKDVDGFHAENIGRLALRQPGLRPCTPRGVMHLLAETGVDLYGKHAVVVGASNHVGRPMALELLLAGCTVTSCHRFTMDLAEHVARADIVIAAVGKPGLVKGEWIKPGAVAIDVGINHLADGSMVGDIEFDAAACRAGWITPVPGGVGPMTRAMLMMNTLEAAQNHD